MEKPFAAIIRSSDRVAERQRDGTYHGDEDQTAEIGRYAHVRGLPVVFLPPELDLSGGLPIDQRPSLRAAIEGVEAGEYAGIITANLKRLTRSRSGIAIWDRVEAVGGRVHCAAENLDTSTPNGRFVRDIHLAEAVREREEHSERHAERRRKTVEAGIWRQRQTPRGLSRDPETRRLVPDEHADEVRQAFLDRARGTTILELSRRLGMTPSGVRQMLRNRVYLGELRDGDHVKVDAHPALVTPDQFDAAHTSQARPPRSMSDGPALLAGLIRCAGCGHVMTRKRTASVVYACPVNHSGERCPEPASVTARTIDEHVERIALVQLERLSVEAGQGRGLELAQQSLADAERELAAYLAGVEAAGLDPQDFAAGARARKDAVEAARAALSAARARTPFLPTSQTGAEVWADLHADERNRLLRSLLACVVVARAGGRGARVALPDRVRVLAFGADVQLPDRRGGEGAGIVPIPLPDADGPDVLRVPGGEDAL